MQRRFLDMGWHVIGIGRRPSHAPGSVSHDLRRPLPTSLEDAQPNAVIHAAALSSPWGTRRDFRQHNVLATQNVVDYCQRVGAPRLVFVSSSSVYYQPCDQLGIRESTPVAAHPVNLYAASKQAAERVVAGYKGPSVVIRPRAVFGPDDTVLFPRILRAARAGRLPLLTPQGDPVVGDLIYIDHLVDCLIAAATRDDLIGAYNVTNAEPVEIVPFLLSIFARLGIARPRRRVNVRTAMRLAFCFETLHGALVPSVEPPITRFGVHVFAYSKTFDVRKALDAFGPPRVSTDEGADRFVEWVKRERPY